MRLQRLVRVYTCKNATLFEISCTGSYKEAGISLSRGRSKVIGIAGAIDWQCAINVKGTGNVQLYIICTELGILNCIFSLDKIVFFLQKAENRKP